MVIVDVAVVPAERAIMIKMDSLRLISWLDLRSSMVFWCIFLFIINGYGSGGGGGGGVVDAKVCGEIDVRNNAWDLEVELRGCTIVAGSVSIVLIERKNATFDINKVSFPELR